MTDGKYQVTFFIRKKKKKKKTHKSWDISSLHLSGINFLFFDFVEVGGLIGSGTAATESGEDHLQPTMHLSRRHAFCRANPSPWPFLNPPKFTEDATLIFSFTYNKCVGAPVGGAAAAEATQSRSLTGRIWCVLHCRLMSWNTLLQSTWVRLNSDSAIVHVGTLWISFFLFLH